MEDRQLGHPSPEVSVLTMGTITFGGPDDVANVGRTDRVAKRQLTRERVSRPPMLHPYRHQAQTASDRLSPADHMLLDPHLDRA